MVELVSKLYQAALRGVFEGGEARRRGIAVATPRRSNDVLPQKLPQPQRERANPSECLCRCGLVVPRVRRRPGSLASLGFAALAAGIVLRPALIKKSSLEGGAHALRLESVKYRGAIPRTFARWPRRRTRSRSLAATHPQGTTPPTRLPGRRGRSSRTRSFRSRGG